MELKDKIVLVTGSSSGIGQAVANGFAKEGAKVVVHYHENKTGGEKTLAEVIKFSEGLLIQADVTKEEDLHTLLKVTEAKFGRLDILINNAANPAEFVPFAQASQEDILKLLNLNTVSTMLLSKYAVESMKKTGGGKIIATSSIKGWEHGGGSVGYAVSKAAINSFTRTFAKAVSPDILVNAVAPGYVKTRVYDKFGPEKIQNWLDGTYLKKWVEMEDVVNAFIFLAKNDSMTGQIVYVDGGFTLK